MRTRIAIALALLIATVVLFRWGAPQPQPDLGAPPSATPHEVPNSRVEVHPTQSDPIAADVPISAPATSTNARRLTAPATGASLAVNPLPAIPMPLATEDEPAPSPVGLLPDSEGDVASDLDRVEIALRDYRTALGENPVGSNAEIIRAMLGDNLKQVKIGVPTGSRMNAEGELIDRWGTPYFFHQLSGTRMEIRSAGADQQMWTRDDAVLGKAEPETVPAVE